MATEIKRLNRFTTLPFLLDFLERKKLVLLDPKSWDDKNDKEVILSYKEKKKIKNLFALCFTWDYETIHHWKTFASGSAGCCIEFDANKLVAIFEKNNLKHSVIHYKKIKELKPMQFDLDDMPFFKRNPYACEQEYRVIWEGNDDISCFEIDVPLETISRITISQHMPRPVFETIKSLLKTSFKDPNKKIHMSTIYDNKRWINFFS